MHCDIVKRYPALEPWVGNQFIGSREKLLILGESHYLPKASTIHKIARHWYSSSQKDLSPQEVVWISTKDIVTYAYATWFKNKAHWIYKNIAQALNTITSLEDYRENLRYIAFSNYFKRPAVDGDSLQVQPVDIQFAGKCLLDLLEQLKPTIVIFTSSLSGKYGEEVIEQSNIPYFTVPHPTCQWWNRTAKKYYGNTGKELLIEFLKECHWNPPKE